MTDPLTPKVADAVIEEAKGLLNKFLGPAFEEAGAMLGNNVRMFRLRQEIKLLRKAEQILNEAGLKPKAVNMRVLLPLLDTAVLEDNEDMAERWASLLASAANPDNQTALEASFIEILKQLVPTHAFVLDVFYEQIKRDKLPPEQWGERGYVFSDLKGFLQKDVPQFDVAIDNLLRLHLVAYPTPNLGIANGHEVRVQVTSSNILCATSLGYAFVSACGHGRTFRNHSYGIPGYDISNVYWTRGGSLNLSPAPSAKAIPSGAVSPELELQILMEAHSVAFNIGCEKPGVALFGRTLRVHLGKMESCKNEMEFIKATFPLREFCAERDLKLETHRVL